MKQVTGKNKGTRKKAAKKVVGKKKASKAKGPADFVEVRKEIATLVRGSATKIAMEVIKVALPGQLAQTKYLFEAVGLYPPTAESQTPKIEDSLAFTLLKRMGLPTEPVIFEEDANPACWIDPGKPASSGGAADVIRDEQVEEKPVEAESNEKVADECAADKIS